VTKGSDVRASEYAIAPLFLDRWSPRAMSGEPLTETELLALFEAAHWAPSSGNTQPWRFCYARRDTEHWPRFLDLLADNNRVWCVHAAVLVVVVSRTTREDSGRPLPTPSYDTGAAWAYLGVQGWMSGLVVHGMAGFDYARAAEMLRLPPDHKVEAMIAIGRPGPPEGLPESHRGRETPSQRRPVRDVVFEGGFRP
jgi:nitroreductase